MMHFGNGDKPNTTMLFPRRSGQPFRNRLFPRRSPDQN